jgi:hypothetical protein
VHLDQLRDTFQKALLDFLEAIAHDEKRLRAVLAKAGIWMINMDQGIVKAFLELPDRTDR